MVNKTISTLKKTILLCCLLASTILNAQPCKTKEELDTEPGKYTNAANYKWPAVKAAYFSGLTTPAEKATARQVLTQIENLELKSRSGFNFTGGVLSNTFSSEGYRYCGTSRLPDYRFQMGFYEYICIRGKKEVSTEYATVLRVYINLPELNSFGNRLTRPFTSPESDYSPMVNKDWKNTGDSPLFAQFRFLSIDSQLVHVINTGKGYYQDVPENKIRKGTRDFIYRYWFIKHKDIPVFLEVSRKEYLESLLEFYEREKEYFSKKGKADGMAKYAYKKAIVQKELSSNSAEWLAQPAMINPKFSYVGYCDTKEDYDKGGYFTFRQFWDNKGGIKLYKYNPTYYDPNPKNKATPQLITIAFRYISLPSSLRLSTNFTENFDKAAWQKLVD